MLSLTCKIAIKAVIYIASNTDPDSRAGIKQIAEYINASEHTVGKLLQKLVKHSIINSNKGPSGGFYITARQMEQPIIKVVLAIDGKDVFNQCGLGLARCSAAHPCPLHNDYKAVRDLFETMCSQKKISELCNPVNNGLAYLVG
ncbi:MAG: Rrf2 family transcriptional regulator [Bacteroidetes bacterium]|nr:Rrf2 family transcriptional regulator [Bacteroidota bacterium]MBS1757329.1 Rrf2 family transcriptional regulator [Bacteroidota bacterium]